MLAQVLIAEADSFVAMWKDLKLPNGRDRVVRHGYGPHRTYRMTTEQDGKMLDERLLELPAEIEVYDGQRAAHSTMGARARSRSRAEAAR